MVGSPGPGQSQMQAARVVLITAPDAAVAESLARELLGRRLVACCNLVAGVRSLYRWQGAVEEAEEVLVIAKTTQARVVELEQAVAALHPYDVPEFVVLTPSHVSSGYASWLEAETAVDSKNA